MIERVSGSSGSYHTQTIEPLPVQPTPRGTSSPQTEAIVNKHGTAGDVSWIGALNALQLAKASQAQQLPPVTTKGSGIATVADYTTGQTKHPPIVHGNGFLQNPNDPNDPTPIPTIPPTDADRQALKDWRNNLELSERMQWLPSGPHTDSQDSLAAYRHFLDGNGRDRTFSYDKFIRDDNAGKTMLASAISDVQLAAEEIYREMVAREPSLASRATSFSMSGSPVAVGHSARFPYPETENWQKAIGAHQIWMSATVTVRPSAKPGDPPQFSMRMALHAEDRYNFNPASSDFVTDPLDAASGRFELTGLARQYTSYATLERDVTWLAGKSEVGMAKPVSGS